MKKTLTLALLSFGTMLAAESTMTGWISDAACNTGNAGASKEQRDCAKRCLEDGENPVFVSDGDSKVYKLVNAANAKDHLKTKVRVTGTVEGDTLTVKKLIDVAE